MRLEMHYEALVMLRRYKNCNELWGSIKMRILTLLGSYICLMSQEAVSIIYVMYGLEQLKFYYQER